jgi:hypothetical protein
MNTQNYLQYEIILLLAKYGERQVLNALASHLQISADVLEERLREIIQLKPRITTKKKADPAAIIETLVAQHADKAEGLKILFSRFQNKTFLPELKDVKRFCNRHGLDIGNVKSRTASVPKLFKLIASLETKAVEILIDDFNTGEYSSLGILADEIMKREK